MKTVENLARILPGSATDMFPISFPCRVLRAWEAHRRLASMALKLSLAISGLKSEREHRRSPGDPR
jgi:hypothetical protein